ncbi:MAG: tRNA lysidine(34) synthetase TilS [Pseudomonadales bacterium]
MSTIDLSAIHSLFPDANEWVLALSGGLDSSVLLHVLYALPDRPELRVVHVNHQLSAFADQWQQQTEQRCAQLDIAIKSVVVDVRRSGHGIEEAARQARYEVFESELGSHSVLMLGHHENDQAETMLLRLLRGAGPRGLSAMPLHRPLGKGFLFRPLLGFRREELYSYAQTHGLQWVEDDSNSDSSFDRNYLRKEVFPLIAARWPGYSKNWTHSSGALREAVEILDECADLDLIKLDIQEEVFGISIDAGQLSGLGQARQNNVLPVLMRDHGFSPMPRAQMDQLLSVLLPAQSSAQPKVEWAGHQACRFAGRVFFLSRLPDLDREGENTIERSASEGMHLAQLPGLCQLSIELDPNTPGSATITIRVRQGGERLAGGDGRHKSLKNWFQENKLPPWLRDRVPLLFVDGELVAVGDIWRCERRVRSIELRWH